MTSLSKASPEIEHIVGMTNALNDSIHGPEKHDTLADSLRRIKALLAREHSMKFEDEIHGTWFSPLWAGVLIPTLIFMLIFNDHLNLSITFPLAVVRSDENSTYTQPFLESFWNDSSYKKSYGHMGEALAGMERGETLACMRVGRNFSTVPHHRFLWSVGANDTDILDIDIITANQEARFFLQKAFNRAYQVSTLTIRPGLGAFLGRAPTGDPSMLTSII